MNNRKKVFDEQFNDIIFLGQFSRDDFKSRYAGSVLGTFWAFIQPLITIAIYWFIFQIGFKSSPIENYPFVLWLIGGLVPWFFLTDGITNSASSLIEYNYLIKKVQFNVNILPAVKVLSAMYVHMFMIVFSIIVFSFYGFFPSVYLLQVVYYLLYMFFLVMGISYLVSAIYVFLKDILQVVPIVLQVMFWMTPIVWDFKIMPEIVQGLLKLNPFYYIIEGYRDCFINRIWFWEKWEFAIYYWVVAIIFYGLGVRIFKNLKPHFADIL